jgi:tetratricopeptide (TPR) repeat protein
MSVWIRKLTLPKNKNCPAHSRRTASFKKNEGSRLGRRIRANGVFLPLGLLLSSALASSAQSISAPLPQPESAVTAGSSDAELLAMVRQKRWKEVVQRAETLRGKSPTDPGTAYWLGIAHLQLHEPIEAVLALRTAENLGLHSALFHEGLGLAYYDLNQFFLFEQQMQQASQLDPLDPKPYYYEGLYRLTIRSDSVRALQLFETATRLKPDDWKSLYQEGYCLEQLGKLADARARYLSAIRLVEQNGDHFGWPFQGIARLVMDENPQEGLDFAEKAVRLEPNEPSNHLVLSGIYQRLGKLPEAIQEAQSASLQNPTDATTRYALYKLYRQARDPRAAEELKMFDEITKLYGAN